MATNDSELRFAIVIPVYNGENFLEQAIQSALAQRRPADEIIILDDASTDNTPAILDRYANLGYTGLSVHRLCRRENAAQAWNEAIRRSSADFVVVLAHDDQLHEQFLQEAEQALRSNPQLDLFISGVDHIDGQGRQLRSGLISVSEFKLPGIVSNESFLDRFTSGGQFFLPSATLFRRTLFENLDGFDSRLRVAYDWDFFLRAGVCATIYLSDRALASYRTHETQSIVGHGRKDNGDSDALFAKLPQLGDRLTVRQRVYLVANMCDFLRRFATRSVLDPEMSTEDVVAARRQIAAQLDSWRSSDNPYSRYVPSTPSHWRQKIMWTCASFPLSIRIARLFLNVPKYPRRLVSIS